MEKPSIAFFLAQHINILGGLWNLHDSTPFIKICGITNTDDGMAALEMGAAILGVVLSDISPRIGTMDLVQKLKDTGAVVATVHTDMNSAILNNGEQDYVQLHFDHTCQDITSFKKLTGKRVISVLKSRDIRAAIRTGIERIKCGADLVLIDTGVPVVDLIKGDNSMEFNHKIGLAGKISPENARAVMDVRPGFLDVSSSIESYPGKKDLALMKKLMEVVSSERRRLYQNS
ncbi:MAG: hypothetical protein QXN26_05065 [Thermoplasmataceae archaeon]